MLNIFNFFQILLNTFQACCTIQYITFTYVYNIIVNLGSPVLPSPFCLHIDSFEGKGPEPHPPPPCLTSRCEILKQQKLALGPVFAEVFLPQAGLASRQVNPGPDRPFNLIHIDRLSILSTHFFLWLSLSSYLAPFYIVFF